jgi:hypothetical protein
MHKTFWFENLRGKRPLGIPRHRWEDNIRIDLREVGCEGVNWINVAQDRDQWRAVVNKVRDVRVLYKGGGGSSLTS